MRILSLKAERFLAEQPMRLGLVLEGGGAKGAFAFGCLKAFQAENVSFSVVAGTSVGALNAALWSTNSLEEGEALWANMKIGDILRLRWRSVFLPLAVLRAFSYVEEVEAWNNLDHGRRGRLFREIRLLIPWVIILTFLLAIVWIPILIAALLIGGWSGAEQLIRSYLSLALFGGGGIFVGGRLLRRLNPALFSGVPLQSLIKKTLGGRPFHIPVFATTAYRKEITVKTWPPSLYVAPVQVQGLWLPKYIRVDEGTALSTLYASAAIPFGVFPRTPEQFVDGGIADNLPILPILENFDCDVVVIVRLRPSKGDCGELIRTHLASVQDRFRLAQEKPHTIREIPRLICIAPSSHQGLLATFNLRSGFTRPLMEEGERCAKLCIREQRLKG